MPYDLLDLIHLLAGKFTQQFRITFAVSPVRRDLDEGHEHTLVNQAFFGGRAKAQIMIL